MMLLLLFVWCGREDMYEYKYVIGSTGPSGGIVFYVNDEGSHGLEAAPASTEWTNKQWSSIGTLVTGTGTEIGTGRTNTSILVTWLNANLETDCAALLCDALVYGNYDDWFLPSKDELCEMYIQLKSKNRGGFSDGYYWSSSEDTLNSAWGQDFSSGSRYTDTKDYTSTSIRAVRAF